MANNSDDYTISEHEDSSDELVEMTPVPLVKKKGDILQKHILQLK